MVIAIGKKTDGNTGRGTSRLSQIETKVVAMSAAINTKRSRRAVVGYFELRARRHAQTAPMLTASVTAQFPSKPSQRVRSGPTYPASSLNANGKPYWYPRQSKQLGRPQNASISTNRATLKPMTVTHLYIKRIMPLFPPSAVRRLPRG